MSLRILFLDDMEARHQAFRDYAAEAGFVVDHAYTAEQAISMLEKGDYFAAALDHDLADEHYEQYLKREQPSGASADLSGRAVARWIAEHGKPERVLVHSFNPAGAAAMYETLRAAVKEGGLRSTHRAPFGPQNCAAWLRWIHPGASMAVQP